jgi:glucose/arabinose dehydrogenase
MTSERVRPDDASYFTKAVHMTQAPGQPDTWYVVQREGQILVIQNGELLDDPFLEIGDRVHHHNYGEKGFLGLAFHPDYQQNGRFFIFYMTGEDPPTEGPYRSIIAEYQVENTDPTAASPQEEQILLDVYNPKAQHNGGTLMFGPDGYLYASHGNGGDEEQYTRNGIGNAQITDNVLGSIMRFDVDRPDADFAAENNPFVGEQGDDRIYLYGLRNPWKYSFDPATGDMYIGDVGKQTIEEIDFVPADSPGGLNFGWPAYEGTIDGPNTDAKSAVEEHTEPIYEYRQQSQDTLLRGGRAVSGGRVYRGEQFPQLRGYYIFGDLYSSELAALLYCDGDGDGQREIVDKRRLNIPPPRTGPRTFAADEEGELYMIGRDEARKIVPAE